MDSNNKVPLSMLVVGAFFGAFVAVLPAAELPFKHDHLNFYPTEGIRVDGDLADWKPEWFVQMYADSELRESFSLRMALAYDAQGVLVAARFTDPSPLINHIDPKVDPFKGWSGDALQLRFITDPLLMGKTPTADQLNRDAIVHLTLWYFTDRAEPVLDARYGMDFHGAVTLTGPSSGLVFKKAEGGYVLEGRIPWSLFKTPPPQPGQRWGMTLQPLWGNAGGAPQHNFFDVITSGGFHFQRPDGWGYAYFVRADEIAAKQAEQAADERRIFTAVAENKSPTGISVKYANPAKGYVSLAICRSDGSIVRTLLAKAEREAGEQTETWNGLDDDGKPVPPGKYRLKGLTHPGLKPRFVTSVHNSGNPPWVTSDGKGGWGGDHGCPVGAASGPRGDSYLLWTFNEGGHFLIGVDAAGQKQWGVSISWGDFSGGATALVYDNGQVYVAKDGMAGKAEDLNKGGLFVFDAATGRRASFPGGVGTLLVTEWAKSLNQNTVEPGAPSERMRAGKYTVADLNANLVGLAASPKRIFASLYLENKIVALDKENFKPAETFNVTRPSGLAYDSTRDLLYAISGNQIVTIKPAPDAKPTSLISQGLAYPYGLALDSRGNLCVSVRGMQMQVLVFDPRGKLVKSIGKKGGRPWVGKFDPSGMLMPAGLSVDSQDQLWVTEYDNTPKRVSLWDIRSGKLIREFFGSAAYAPMMAPDPEKPEEVYIHNTRFIIDYDRGTVRPDATVFRAGYEGRTITGSEAGYGFMGATFEVQSFQGKKFAFNGHGGVFRWGPDRFKPFLSIAGTNYWVDINKDGLIDDSEMQPIKGPPLGNNIAQFGGTFYPGAAFIQGGRIFRPIELTADGALRYPKPEEALPVLHGGGPMKQYSNWMDVWPSFQSDWKEFYAIASLPNPVNGGMDGGGGDGIFRFTGDGQIRWRYSRVAVFYALKSPLAKTGDLCGALRILGEAELPKENGGEIVGIGCYRGYDAFLNEDGLFIDQVGYDNGRGPMPNFDVFFIENFSGYFFRHPRTGKLYLFGGDVDGRILELQGWEKIRRFDAGQFTLSDSQYQAVLAAGGAGGDAKGIQKLTVAAMTPPLDGTFGGWAPDKLVPIALDETRKAQAGLAYDEQNLYALFKVPDASPWKNGSKDWKFIFKGGDAVDLQLGVNNPLTDGSKRKPQPGDVRVMIAPMGDGAECQTVAMWKQLGPGMTAEPMVYKSPVAEERFERVALLSGAVCRTKRQAGDYLVEVKIPWSELGMKPPARHVRMQGDAGILCSDGSGTLTTRRCYFFNEDTGVVNDIPSEVRINTANWGPVIFE